MIRNFMSGLGGWRKPTPEAALPPRGSEEKTILIIDRQGDNPKSGFEALGDGTLRIETAGTARSAIQKLSVRHPHLVLLDSDFPAADGTRLARRLLADDEIAFIPMVALTDTANGAPDGRFDGFIERPIDAATFTGKIRRFFEQARQAGSQHEANSQLSGEEDGNLLKPAAGLLAAIDAGLPDPQFAAGRGPVSTDSAKLWAMRRSLRWPAVCGARVVSGAPTVRARSRLPVAGTVLPGRSRTR